MKNEKIIAIIDLAAVGVAGLSMYKKPILNKLGFSNATGSFKSSSQNCAVCRTPEGDTYHTGISRNCNVGDTCITRYSFEKES
jgi:hypothetical protein